MRDIRCRLNCGEADEEQLLRMARLLVGVQNLAGKNGCNSVAIQCWEPLQRAVGAACCTVNGILTERGLPVACETDVHGAVTSILLQAACERASSVFFADLTIRHPDNDNSVLLWHCGNFPPSLAIDAKARALSVLHNPFGDCASQSKMCIRDRPGADRHLAGHRLLYGYLSRGHPGGGRLPLRGGQDRGRRQNNPVL